MSLFDTAKAGLAAQAAAIQVTSSNVANASSVGYKSSDYLFTDQYFRPTQSRGTSSLSDFGAKRNQVQGSIRASSSSLDLAIQGSGMFCLASAPAVESASKYYSRNGQFSVDKEGQIVNANGLYLMGYQPNATLTGVTASVAGLKIPSPALEPRASETGVLSLNLDGRVGAPTDTVDGVTSLAAFNADDSTSYNSTTTMVAYDAQGIEHLIQLYFKRIDDTTAVDPRQSASADKVTAKQYTVYAEIDGYNVSAATQSTVASADSSESSASAAGVITTLKFIDGQVINSLAVDTSGVPLTQETANFQLTDANGSLFSLSLDLTDVTAFGAQFQVNENSIDGYVAGKLSGLRVDETGRLLGEYTNGETLIAGQLLLATFNSQTGLDPASNNVFTESFASGAPLFGTATAGSFGSIRGSSLEESNIDMASELVALMVQQRNYQANSQSIRAADNLLNTAINLGR